MKVLLIFLVNITFLGILGLIFLFVNTYFFSFSNDMNSGVQYALRFLLINGLSSLLLFLVYNILKMVIDRSWISTLKRILVFDLLTILAASGMFFYCLYQNKT